MNKIAWLNIDREPFTLKEISNVYLGNILRFIAVGGGHDDFVNTEVIVDLFEEAEKRNLNLNLDLSELITVQLNKQKERIIQ